MSGPERVQRRDGKNGSMSDFSNLHPLLSYWNGQMKQDGVGHACGTNGRDEKCVHFNQ